MRYDKNICQGFNWMHKYKVYEIYNRVAINAKCLRSFEKYLSFLRYQSYKLKVWIVNLYKSIYTS